MNKTIKLKALVLLMASTFYSADVSHSDTL